MCPLLQDREICGTQRNRNAQNQTGFCLDQTICSSGAEASWCRLQRLQGGFTEGRHRILGHVCQRRKARHDKTLPACGAPPQRSQRRWLVASEAMPTAGNGKEKPESPAKPKEDAKSQGNTSSSSAGGLSRWLSPAKGPAVPGGWCAGRGDVPHIHRANPWGCS